MVNNILDTARLREGPLPYDRRPFSAEKLLEEIIRLYQPLAQKTKKTLRLDAPAALPLLLADEEKALRIFMNLLTNAFKFTREGDRITVSAGSEEPGRIAFTVSDTGWGIAPERLARLFEPFQSTNGAEEDVRKNQGAGLGLSIVKALVEGHGGTLRVESTPREGTAFHFSLPAAEASP